MQPWHRGLDSCEGDLEISAKARIPDVDAAKPVVINATLVQHPNMFATQRNHQISSKVLSTDQRSPMIRRHRITTLTQHRARLLIGAIAHTSDCARTGHPHHITQTALLQLRSEVIRVLQIEVCECRQLGSKKIRVAYRQAHAMPTDCCRDGVCDGTNRIGHHSWVRVDSPRRRPCQVVLFPVPDFSVGLWGRLPSMRKRSETLAPMPTTGSRLRRCSPPR